MCQSNPSRVPVEQTSILVFWVITRHECTYVVRPMIWLNGPVAGRVAGETAGAGLTHPPPHTHTGVVTLASPLLSSPGKV